MPKAVLVIDMPRDCIDCPCYHVLNNKPICEVNGLTSLYSTNYTEERPSFCSLRPLPEKCDIEKLVYPEDGWEELQKDAEQWRSHWLWTEEGWK